MRSGSLPKIPALISRLCATGGTPPFVLSSAAGRAGPRRGCKNVVVGSELRQELQGKRAQGIRNRQENHRVDVGDSQNEETDAAREKPGKNHEARHQNLKDKNDDLVREKGSGTGLERVPKTANGRERRKVSFVHDRGHEFVQKEGDVAEGDAQGEQAQPHGEGVQRNHPAGQVAFEPSVQGQEAEDQISGKTGETGRAEREAPHEEGIAQFPELAPGASPSTGRGPRCRET